MCVSSSGTLHFAWPALFLPRTHAAFALLLQSLVQTLETNNPLQPSRSTENCGGVAETDRQTDTQTDREVVGASEGYVGGRSISVLCAVAVKILVCLSARLCYNGSAGKVSGRSKHFTHTPNG